ncbi:FG-GAP repeat protein [Planctomycetes bacterium Pla163]|uniref:FG-GAP repeat protein n=1 Tax=Rohdeia mirabilis TaxID=2528008 RepID=A0A518D4A1_9BACT|nr:FG-GAP repeat protein [Planctomycetes bacterium Pla163]
MSTAAALAALLSLSLAPSTPDVTARLPLAPPAQDERWIGMLDLAGEPCLVGWGPRGAFPAAVHADADGLHAQVGAHVALALDPVLGAALDVDGDGRESWWCVQDGVLVELVVTDDGALERGATVASISGAVLGFVDGALPIVATPSGEEVVGTLVQTPGGIVLEHLWSAPSRSRTAARGASGDLLIAVDATGNGWVVGEGALAVDLPFELRSLRALSNADETLVLLAETVDGACLRFVAVSASDGSLRGTFAPVALEGGAAELENATALDLDGDGDIDLARFVPGTGLVARTAWGLAGYLAPRTLTTAGADASTGASSVRRFARLERGGASERPAGVLALTPDAVQRVDGSGLDAQAAPLDGGQVEALDLDGDGDADLVLFDPEQGAFIGRNDATGTFTFQPIAAAPTALVPTERDGRFDLVGRDARGWFVVESRPDGRHDPESRRAIALPLRADAFLAGDLDGDGTSELVGDGSVFARGPLGEWEDVAPAPWDVLCLADVDGDGRDDAFTLYPSGRLVNVVAATAGLALDRTLFGIAVDAPVDAIVHLPAANGAAAVIAVATGAVCHLVEQRAGTWIEVARVSLALDAADGEPLHLDVVPGTDGEPSELLVANGDGRVQRVYRVAGGDEWRAGTVRRAPLGTVATDVDGDGDTDLVGLDHGLQTWAGTRHAGDDAGRIQQYGAGELGSDGQMPLLGARGPVRASTAPGEVRLVGVLGGATLFVAVTPFDWVLDQRHSSWTGIFDATQLSWIGGRADGRFGEPGVGRWTFGLDFLPGLVGRTLIGQAFVLDDGAIGGISASNRVAVTFGR